MLSPIFKRIPGSSVRIIISNNDIMTFRSWRLSPTTIDPPGNINGPRPRRARTIHVSCPSRLLAPVPTIDPPGDDRYRKKRYGRM